MGYGHNECIVCYCHTGYNNTCDEDSSTGDVCSICLEKLLDGATNRVYSCLTNASSGYCTQCDTGRNLVFSVTLCNHHLNGSDNDD